MAHHVVSGMESLPKRIGRARCRADILNTQHIVLAAQVCSWLMLSCVSGSGLLLAHVETLFEPLDGVLQSSGALKDREAD